MNHNLANEALHTDAPKSGAPVSWGVRLQMKNQKLLICCFCLLVAGATGAAGASPFGKILPKLKAKTTVPLRLPTYLPESNSSRLYATLHEATSTSYTVKLAFTLDCDDSTACRYGEVYGASVDEWIKPEGSPVTLERGITGFFQDADCRASCGDSTISWKEGNYLYTVGIKAGPLETLRKIANSAITNSSANRK